MTASERFRKYLSGEVIVSVDHQTPPDVPMEYYKEYVKLLYEYCEKATHKGENIVPCPVFENGDLI